MIWIDLEHKLPTDTNIPGWTPWTQQQWDAWLAESARLRNELAALEAAGKRKERNELIDENSAHWSALKPWFEKLSYGKCWFSETSNSFCHYDVEHFRPKKQAKGLNRKTRDGYWWLAFDHMNYRLIGNVGNRKKGIWFPLAQGSLCASYGCTNEESESRYFIDPIDDDDVALIAFDEEGKVVAVPNANEWDRERVEHTVRLIKLNEHRALAEQRRKVWQYVSGLIAEYAQTRQRCTRNNPAAKAKLKQVAKEIRASVQRTTELSSVAHWCIVLRNDPQLAKLLG